MVVACSGLGCTGSNLKPRCLRLTFIWASLADDQFGTEMSFGATGSELIGLREPLTCGPPRLSGDPHALDDPRFRGVPRHFHDRSDADRVLGRESRTEISRLRGGTGARTRQ